MRKLAIAILILMPLFLAAQTARQQTKRVDYQIQGLKDSFFLDEIVTTLDTNGNVVNVAKSSQLFRSKEQIFFYVGNLHNLAVKAKADAEKIMADAKAKAKKELEEADANAKKLLAISPWYDETADKIDVVARQSEHIFSGKKPAEKPPTKPKKKKKT